MTFQFQHSHHLPIIIWHSTGSSLFAVGLSNPDPNKAHTLHLAEMPLKSLLLQNRFLSIKTPKTLQLYDEEISTYGLSRFSHSGVYCLRPCGVFSCVPAFPANW